MVDVCDDYTQRRVVFGFTFESSFPFFNVRIAVKSIKNPKTILVLL
jgi:hypothetical protein